MYATKIIFFDKKKGMLYILSCFSKQRIKVANRVDVEKIEKIEKEKKNPSVIDMLPFPYELLIKHGNIDNKTASQLAMTNKAIRNEVLTYHPLEIDATFISFFIGQLIDQLTRSLFY